VSDIEPNDLESIVNRYLDGDVTDEQLEAFLRGSHEHVDFEQIRTFKSRVEKIEEIYRQLGEPEVPDGYWDSFADRVTARFPSTERRSLGNRVADILLPTRWPKAAFGYAGAIASVALVLVVGRSILESGKTKYEPTPSQEIRQEEEGSITQPEVVAPTTPEERHGELLTGEAVEKAEAGSPIPAPHEELKKGTSDQPGNTTQETADLEIARPNTEQARTPGAPIETEQPSQTQPVTVEAEEQSSQPMKVEVLKDQVATEDKSATPSSDEAISIVRESKDVMEMNKPEVLIDISPKKTGDKANSVTPLSASRTGSYSSYDSWNLDRLREKYSAIQQSIADSGYASPAFVDFAELASAIAIRSCDSTEIDRAISAIDTLFKCNPDIDSARWLERRNILESIRIESK
jgi:hypothetical protein